MRFAYLGSGSRGNAAIIESGNTRIMLDCGFSIKETVRRLARLDLTPEDLTAILVTHEHSDHIAGVGKFARKFSLPVWMTPGTYATEKAGELPGWVPVNSHERFAIGGIDIQPVPVPHDAKEPCQYVFQSGGLRLGILTDVGHITPYIERHYGRCDVLVVECNHDVQMLRDGAYPYTLKQRVGGNYGHLNNQQAAALLSQVDQRRLRHVLAVHLSDKNNTVDLALQALKDVVNDASLEIQAADQNDGTNWCCMRSLVDTGNKSRDAAMSQITIAK